MHSFFSWPRRLPRLRERRCDYTCAVGRQLAEGDRPDDEGRHGDQKHQEHESPQLVGIPRVCTRPREGGGGTGGGGHGRLSGGHQANRRSHGLDLAGGTARPGPAGRAGQRSSPQWHMSYGQQPSAPPVCLASPRATRGGPTLLQASAVAQALARWPRQPRAPQDAQPPPQRLCISAVVAHRRPQPCRAIAERGALMRPVWAHKSRGSEFIESQQNGTGIPLELLLGNLSAGNRRSCCLLWGNRSDDSVAARLVRMI